MSYYYSQGNSSRLPPSTSVTTEFDVLKSAHKFLREDNPEEGRTSSKDQSWEDQVAKKYYDSLYREFAVCDLKHYKSGNFALRWRTEDEVISGRGEETCGNTRCKRHDTPDNHQPETPERSHSKKNREENKDKSKKRLNTVELPFAYEEHGEQKAALVKVVLCDSCLRKLMWKREKEKEMRGQVRLERGEEKKKPKDGVTEEVDEEVKEEVEMEGKGERRRGYEDGTDESASRHSHRRHIPHREGRGPSDSQKARERGEHERRRRRSSRSFSPIPRRSSIHLS